MRRLLAVTALALLVVSAALAAPPRAKVAVRTTQIGSVLVDGRGHTLYVFDQPTCTGTCAAMWPAFLTSGKPLGVGVSAAKLGMKKLRSGKLQVTYAGKALYFYAGDSGAGQVAGASVPHWAALSAAGAKVRPAGGTTTTPPPPTYGGGDGY